MFLKIKHNIISMKRLSMPVIVSMYPKSISTDNWCDQPHTVLDASVLYPSDCLRDKFPRLLQVQTGLFLNHWHYPDPEIWIRREKGERKRKEKREQERNNKDIQDWVWKWRPIWNMEEIKNCERTPCTTCPITSSILSKTAVSKTKESLPGFSGYSKGDWRE